MKKHIAIYQIYAIIDSIEGYYGKICCSRKLFE